MPLLVCPICSRQRVCMLSFLSTKVQSFGGWQPLMRSICFVVYGRQFLALKTQCWNFFYCSGGFHSQHLVQNCVRHQASTDALKAHNMVPCNKFLCCWHPLQVEERQSLCFSWSLTFFSGHRQNKASVKFCDIQHPKCQGFEIRWLLVAHLAR